MADVIESFLRGLERPLILWLLSKKPSHGYGLIKELRDCIGIKVKPSMLYPFLHNLEAAGFIRGNWIKEDGRNIKYYYLTSKGEKLLRDMRDFFKKTLKDMLSDFLQ